MKAIAVYPAARRLALIDHPQPKPAKPTDVELKILEVGVCGTDREIAHFQYGEAPPDSDYLILGHEALAEVVTPPPGSTSLKAGDLVVPMVRMPCGEASCLACSAGRQDFCFTGKFTELGIKGRHGFMTERVVVEASRVVRLPEALRDVGVLIEPLTIAEKALVQVRDIQQRLPWTHRELAAGEIGGHGLDRGHQRALVLGAGPVGLLGAMALRAREYDVFVYSREPANGPKARIVEGIGATYLSGGDHPLADLPAQLGNLDVIYEATGASRFAFQALSVLGTNGVFVFTGVPGRKGPIEFDTDRVMRDLVLRNQVLLGTVNAGPEAYARAVHDLAYFHATWPQPLRALLTGRHRPEDYEALLTQASGIKETIRFGPHGDA